MSYSQIFLLERLDVCELFSAITAGVLGRHLEAPDISQWDAHCFLNDALAWEEKKGQFPGGDGSLTGVM